MNFSIEEYENLLPFERDILIGFFKKQKEKESEEIDKIKSGIDSKWKPK